MKKMDIHIKKELKTEIYEEEYSRSPKFGDLNMSCISNNFSSFFLDSLNDPSEFAKYLGNAENKSHPMEEQVFGCGGGCSSSNSSSGGGSSVGAAGATNGAICLGGSGGCGLGTDGSYNIMYGHENNVTGSNSHVYNGHHHHNHHHQHHHHHHSAGPQHSAGYHHESSGLLSQTSYDGQFEFSKYLRHSEYGETTPPNTNSLIDLDNTPPTTVTTTTTAAAAAIATTTATPTPGATSKSTTSSSSAADIEAFDHDSKQNIFDVHNSNESTGTSVGGGDQRISSNTSECSDNSSNQMNTTKPLIKFVIKENFDVHQAHKVEEGIFQHMNKLPVKKKETLKQLGVTFTGHMSVSDKSIIVDNFSKFCEEYNINDHRPFLALNQSGMLKPEQIKFARYLGQGLPNFTLFCIYSNFKNLFCTKRFENYSKGTYNLQYILEKTKRFLTCTTADLKNLSPQLCEGNDLPTNNNGVIKHDMPKILERLTIFENFDVHESHRIEDGIFTHISRLSPKKQELLKQFGIQSNHNVTYYEKHIIIENFIRFCNEYGITDHRPFLDFHESGLPKMEQIKFARYLGQGLPNLTLYKIYSSFKDLLAMNRLEKLFTNEGYRLDMILKKKKKNLLSRMNSAASRENQDAGKQGNLKKAAS